jgi:HlyD family secretion protein
MAPPLRRTALAVGAGLLLLAGGWAGLAKVRGPQLAAVQPVRQPLRQTLLVTGRVVWPARTELGFLAPGTVAAVPVDEGDTVEGGALLVQLDDAEARARLEEAQAREARASAQWRRLRGPGRSVAAARVDQARVAAEDAARTLQRQELLFAAGDISAAELDAARVRRDTAASELLAAEQEAAASGRGGADSAAATATLAEARAGLAQARLSLDRTQLRAPTAARVLERRVEPGQLVRAGDPVLVLSGAAPLAVEITPDEVHLGRLQPGLSATVALQAFPDRPLAATVTALAPQVDPARGTVRVDLRFDAPAPDWVRADMTASVEVLLGETSDALVLPVEHLHDRDGARPWVWVAEEGRAQQRPVVLGLEGEAVVEITEGLTESALVLPGAADLTEGQAVRPVPSLGD